MQVTVLYFAGLREARGQSSEVLEVDDGTTVSDLYARIFPPGPEGSLPVGFACNSETVAGDTTLSDGDEVAFLPPLGGG